MLYAGKPNWDLLAIVTPCQFPMSRFHCPTGVADFTGWVVRTALTSVDPYHLVLYSGWRTNSPRPRFL